MGEIPRLDAIYPFDADIVASVAEVAKRQNRMTFAEIADEHNIYGAEGNLRVKEVEGSKYPLEVLTLTPDGDYDETHARVHHLPMANSLSPNMVMRSLRLFEADPTEQMIIFGNPAFGHRDAPGRIELPEMHEILRDNTLGPVVRQSLRFLYKQGIRSTSQAGYSYGADLAVMSAQLSQEHGQVTTQGVFIEPATTVKRTLVGLLRTFASAGGDKLRAYVEQTESAPYIALCHEEKNFGLDGYATGLLRASNLAIAMVLKNDGFVSRVDAAMDAAEDMRVSIGWGTNSELSPAYKMQQAVDQLSILYGSDRVSRLRLRGMRHAGCNDIDLYAAMMLQGLRQTEPLTTPGMVTERVSNV